jgi:hypothetical protein
VVTTNDQNQSHASGADQESSHDIASVGSPPSTLPMDEAPFHDIGDAAHTTIVLDDDDDDDSRATNASSRSLRNNRHGDYSYQDYEDIMSAVVAPSPRKRKRKTTNALQFDSMLVSIPCAGLCIFFPPFFLILTDNRIKFGIKAKHGKRK